MAAGSVALWLLRGRRHPPASAALPPPGTVFRPVVDPNADEDDSIYRAALARNARQSDTAGAEPIRATTVWAIPAYSTALPLPWVHRAENAIRLGRADELRRVAAEMEGAGQDMEAGLLENYALLLERSRTSRERVLTEVVRMLRAATVHRRSAPMDAAALAPVDSMSSLPPESSFIPPPPHCPVEPVRVPAPPSPFALVDAHRVSSDRPVVPMPVLAIGEKRRASR